MRRKHERVYWMLRTTGHSDESANTVIELASNNSSAALRWVRRVHKIADRRLWIKAKREAV